MGLRDRQVRRNIKQQDGSGSSRVAWPSALPGARVVLLHGTSRVLGNGPAQRAQAAEGSTVSSVSLFDRPPRLVSRKPEAR